MSDDRLILCCEFTADGDNFFFVPDAETFDALVLLSELGADEASEFGGFAFNLKYDSIDESVPVITMDNIKEVVEMFDTDFLLELLGRALLAS